MTPVKDPGSKKAQGVGFILKLTSIKQSVSSDNYRNPDFKTCVNVERTELINQKLEKFLIPGLHFQRISNVL